MAISPALTLSSPNLIEVVDARSKIEDEDVCPCHLDKRVMDIAIRNLSTNDPEVIVVNHKFTLLNPPTTLKENIELVFMHMKHNVGAYLDALGKVLAFVSVLAICAVISITVLKTLNADLNKFYDDILNERLIWVDSQFGHFIRKVTMDDYYARSFASYTLAVIFGAFQLFCLVPLGSQAYDSFNNLKNSIQNFLKEPCHLQIQCEIKKLAYPENIANDSDGTCFSDPITLNGIKKEWAHAPRFITIGPYLFSLDSILDTIFRKPLDKGQIRHPLELKVLTKKEQEKLITDLSELFAIHKEKVIDFWDPYFHDPRKSSPEFSQSEKVLKAKSQFEKDNVLQELLFEDDLADMMPRWKSLNDYQKAAIKKQVRDDYFINKRVSNLFREVKFREILDLEIKVNDGLSFTLREIKKKASTFHKKVQIPL